MFKMKKFFILFSLATIFFSCSTDIDLNADYKDITVVYGLLDKGTDMQYIKVNKTFLGDAPVSEMAAVSDSFIYKSATVMLKKYHNDTYIKTIHFVYNDTIPKDAGYFANDKNVIYITDEKIIEESEENNLEEYSYKLVVQIPGKPEVTSEAKLVSNVKLLPPISYKPSLIFYQSYGTSGQYIDLKVKYQSAKNALLYEVYTEIKFYEKLQGSDDYTMKTLMWRQLDKRSTSIKGDETLESVISGSGLFNYIHSQIKNTSADERIFYSIRFYFVAAGETLTKYIDLTSPDYGIVQEKPSFTNVKNGWGLFSSRGSNYSDYKKLEKASIGELSDGQYTSNDGFLNYNDMVNFYYSHTDLDFQYLYTTAP